MVRGKPLAYAGSVVASLVALLWKLSSACP